MNVTSRQSSALSLAIHATKCLRDNARELSKERGIKANCSELEAELTNVCQCLEIMGEMPGTIVEEPRLVKLLDNLEKLCQWGNRGRSSSSHDKTFDRRRYPALVRLLANREGLKGAIREFASDSRAERSRAALLKLLAAFVRQKREALGPDRSELQLADTKEQDDYQAYIRALYSSLASHCLCTREGSRNEIIVNVRLNGCCTPNEAADSFNFRLFFLDHPHRHSIEGKCQWQDAQVCVVRERGIKLKAEPASDMPAYSGQLISADTFCETITNRERTQLRLAVFNGNLLLEGPGRLSQDFLLGESSVSLTRLLDNAKLSQKMKLLLSYLLAKAAWQFYDSDWMQKGWTKESVHFMFERRQLTPTAICINQPFLSARFDGCFQAKGGLDDKFRAHPFPKLLALGIMLLEIELGIKIEEHRMPEDLDPNGEPSVNADHFAAMELFDKDALWDEKGTFLGLKDVIKLCLNPVEFIPFSNDAQGFRDAFQEGVVKCLQALYKIAWENPDTSNVPAVELQNTRGKPLNADNDIAGKPPLPMWASVSSPATSVPCNPYNPASIPFDDQLSERPSHSLSPPVIARSYTVLQDAIMSTRSSFTSDDWFNELSKLNSVLRPKPKEKDATYRPAKIAILDTGVNEDYADSIKDFKDFVNGEDDWQDSTGHGTSAVKLVQRVYHMAEIYVGRVFEAREATENTPALMAEAMLHAVKTWKVDVIVMPSGFRSEDSQMEDAINEARSARVLIFAAASNYGNVIDIAFPARLYVDLKLFCMFSTNSSVRALSNFNPSPLSSKARFNFAILGENITLPNHEEALSGTSFAAVIGGGLAGRVLDFSRHKDNRERIRRADKLHTVEGMSAVFERMVEGAVDNSYHCMAPWKILPSEISGESSTAKRERERAYICETISRALEDMHRK